MELINDTGVSPTDKVTSDPRVQALIDGSFWNNGGSANIEFDHNADGSGDGVVVPTTQGVPFEYDPRVSDPAISDLVGAFTLQYRALEYDYYGNLIFQGGWQSFSMTLEGDENGDISVTDQDSQNVQSGGSIIDLGTTDLNTPLTHSFTVHNLGSGDLTLEPQNMQLPSDFVLVQSPDSTVAPFAQTTFTIEATASQTGFHSGPLALPNSDPDDDPFTFTLEIEVVGPTPEIEVTDSLGNNVADGTGGIDLGSTYEGSPIEHEVTISNTGDATLEISPSSLQVPGGFVLDGSYDASIAPGQSTVMTFQLSAITQGSYSGDVVFSTNDADENPYSFELQGVVEPNPSSPAVTGLHLVNNDGVSSADRIASDPTLGGTVVGDFAGGSVTIEFDHDADNSVDGATEIASTGEDFTYDPRVSQPGLSSHTGWLPLRYRHVHKDSGGGVLSIGHWQDYTVIVDATATAGALSINDFAIDRDTGTSAIDRLTITPIVVGSVSGSFSGGTARVEFAKPETDIVTGSVTVANSGDAFSFDPRLADGSLAGFVGETTVRYRLVHVDGTEAPIATSDWINFALTLEEPPPGGFEIEDLDLVNDDGDSNTDNATTDPTVAGSVVYLGNNYYDPPDPGNVTLQYDVNGDDQVDGTELTNGDGAFEFRPSGLEYGQQTVRVRALQWDVEYATYLVGP